MTSQSQQEVLREFQRRGYRPNIVLQCEASEAVKVTVQKGYGVEILHRDAVERDFRNGDLERINVPELKKIEVKIFIIYDKRKSLSAIAKNFLHTLHAIRISKVQGTAKKIGVRLKQLHQKTGIVLV